MQITGILEELLVNESVTCENSFYVNEIKMRDKIIQTMNLLFNFFYYLFRYILILLGKSISKVLLIILTIVIILIILYISIPIVFKFFF